MRGDKPQLEQGQELINYNMLSVPKKKSASYDVVLSKGMVVVV